MGVGVGAAMSAESTLLITASKTATTGLKLSAGAALTTGLFGAFATGGLGYVARTFISDQESFELSNMFIEAGINSFSGFITFGSAMVGGIIGVKKPEKSTFKYFALYNIGALGFGIYFMKVILAIIKQKLKEKY